MAEPFLSEIRIFSFSFPPKGWAGCNGQLLSIQQNTALFALIGTTYGGNGQTNFALPNLKGRCSMHVGNSHTLGESAGEEDHTLQATEMPSHTHQAVGSGTGNAMGPKGMFWAQDNADAVLYSSGINSTMNSAAIGDTGGSQPHENRAPFLALNFCIALVGIFPSRN